MGKTKAALIGLAAVAVSVVIVGAALDSEQDPQVRAAEQAVEDFADLDLNFDHLVSRVDGGWPMVCLWGPTFDRVVGSVADAAVDQAYERGEWEGRSAYREAYAGQVEDRLKAICVARD